MSKAKTERHQDNADFISAGDLNTSMYWFGDLNVWGAFPTAPTIYQKPRSAVFYVTRNWFERSVFLKAMTLLKFDLYNYGFKLTASRPPGSGATKADQKEWSKKNDAIQQWAEDNKLAVANLVRDAWSEWLIMDNVIALWMKDQPPVVQAVEHVTFNDDYGIQNLTFTHGISPQQAAQLPRASADIKRALAANQNLTLQKQGDVTNNKLFGFETVKRTKVGMGLAWPQIRTLFNTVGTWESLELADWQLADALRTVYELHQIGHEIKNGPRAGLPDHFWKKKRGDAVNRLIKPNPELLATIKRLVVNFDHNIEYPRPDPKHFTKDRYEAALQRMCYWAMPLAQMLFAPQINLWHGNFLKAKAHTERDYIGAFLDTVLRTCLKAPEGTTCTWSDDVFTDPRMMADTLKAGLTNGPLSQETFLEKTGHSAQQERGRKDAENDLPNHQKRPAWDGAHGIDPSNPEAGRPPGAGDKGKRQGKG